MKVIIFSIFFTLFFAFYQANQSVPIPNALEGLKFGNSSATFKVEAHYDLLCPDCKDSFKAFKQVIQDLDLKDHNFKFEVHFFPWAFHTFSFQTTIAAKYIQLNYGDCAAWKYVQLIFENQNRFASKNITINDVNDIIGEIVDNGFNNTITHDEIKNSLNNSTYINLARIGYKIGSQRAVVVTPTYLINQVKIDDAKFYGYDEWKNLLGQYFVNQTNESENDNISFLKK